MGKPARERRLSSINISELEHAVEELIKFLATWDAKNSMQNTIIREIIQLQHKNIPTINTKCNLYVNTVKATSMLLKILATGLPKRSDQVLGSLATAGLFRILHTDFVMSIVEHCLSILNRPGYPLDLTVGYTQMDVKVHVTHPVTFKMCLSYAFLQYGVPISSKNKEIILDMVEEECYKYSRLTTLAFKTLNNFLSHHDKPMSQLTYTHLRVALEIVHNNWNNPINDIRKEIFSIYSLIIDVSSHIKFTVETQLTESLRNYSWKMKNLYFILSVLLPKYGVLKAFKKFPDLPVNLMTSLESTYLVSAGSLTYKNILMSFQDAGTWWEYFGDHVIFALLGDNEKVQIHLLGYWLSFTIAKFPELLFKFLDTLKPDLSRNSSSLFSYITLVNLGCKEGFLINIWKVFPDLSILKTYLYHDNEHIRLNAFSSICYCSKKSLQLSPNDFSTVQQFLKDNITTNNPGFRNTMTIAFRYFLSRIANSYAATLNNSPDPEEDDYIQEVFLFWGWLHKFLLNNLLPGVNYQRKIFSLQLYLEVLRSCCSMKKDSGNLEDCRPPEGLHIWQFENSFSRAIIVDCACDPTNDVQKIAVNILETYFLPNCGDEGVTLVKDWVKRGLALFQSPLFYDAESGANLLLLASNVIQKHVTEPVFIKSPISLCNIHGFQRMERPGSKDQRNDMEEHEKFINTDEDAEQLVTEENATENDLMLQISRGIQNLELEYDTGISKNIIENGRIVLGKLDTEQIDTGGGESVADSLEIPFTSQDYLEIHNSTIESENVSKKQESKEMKKNKTELDVIEKQDVKHQDIEGKDANIEQKSDVKKHMNISEKLRSLHKYSILIKGCNKVEQMKYGEELRNLGIIYCVDDDSQEKFDQKPDVLETIGLVRASSLCNSVVAVPEEASGILDGQNITVSISLPEYLLSIVKTQWTRLQENLFEAVASGFSLYGALTALGPLVPIYPLYFVDDVVDMIKKIVNHFLLLFTSQSKSTSVSPSFAEMSMAINNLLPDEDSWDAGLSPHHQMMLSYLWLTLKACVNLASCVLCDEGTSGELASECLLIVYEVLTKCRHKGVIEAAGSALGAMVACATSNDETRETSGIFKAFSDKLFPLKDSIEDMLQKVLTDVVDKSVQTSVTRRSASMAILIHQIVASDKQPEKPLLQLCMQHLLHVANMPLPSHTQENDIPQSCAIHLMCKLVQDSSLRRDMALYANKIVPIFSIAFSSSLWILRNAGLQLFGVFVPLLIGEKKLEDDDDIFGHSTLEEFYSHYPDLMNHFMNSLQLLDGSYDNFLTVIPFLSLFSKISVFHYEGRTISDSYFSDLLKTSETFLVALFDNKNYAVRKLATKAYFKIMTLPVENLIDQVLKEIVTPVQNQRALSENKLHSLLMLLQHAYKYIDHSPKFGTKLYYYRKLDTLVPCIARFSWFSQTILTEIRQQVNVPSASDSSSSSLLTEIIRIVTHPESSIPSPGVHVWGIRSAEILIQSCPEKELLTLWEIVYKSEWDELSISILAVLKEKLSKVSAYTNSELCQFFLHSVGCENWCRDLKLLHSLYEILLLNVPFIEICSIDILKLIYIQNAEFKNGVQCWSIALPLTCGVCYQSLSKDQFDTKEVIFMKTLVGEVYSRAKTDYVEADVRQNGALAFTYLFRIISQSSVILSKTVEWNEIVTMAVDSGVMFLQDAESSVRNEAARCVDGPKVPFAYLKELLSLNSLLSVFSPLQACRYLHSKLLNFGSCDTVADILRKETTDSSPFDHGVLNIYAEETVVLQIIADSLLTLVKDHPHLADHIISECRSSFENVVCSIVKVLVSFKYAPAKGLPSVAASYVQSLLVRLYNLIHISSELKHTTLFDGYRVLFDCITDWERKQENQYSLVPSYIKHILLHE